MENRWQQVIASGWQCNCQTRPGSVAVITQGRSPGEGCWCEPLVTSIKGTPGKGGTTLSPTVSIQPSKGRSERVSWSLPSWLM